MGTSQGKVKSDNLVSKINEFISRPNYHHKKIMKLTFWALLLILSEPFKDEGLTLEKLAF